VSLLSTNRAQVESLGSLLLVAVVVVSVGTFGAYYVASTTGGGAGGTADGANGADSFDFAVGVTQDELRISHNGGPSVPTTDLRILVENVSGEYTYTFDDGAVQGGDGNDRFDAGETWELTWDQSTGVDMTISLVDTGEERLLFRQSVTTESAATDRPSNVAGGEEINGALGGEAPGETLGGDGDGDDDGDEDEAEDKDGDGGDDDDDDDEDDEDDDDDEDEN